MTTIIILAIAEIFGMFAIGWLARHLKYIGETEINRWSHFLIDFLFPLLVFHSIIKDFETDRLSELWVLPFLGLGVMTFGALCGFVLRRALKSSSKNLIKTFHHCCAINNCGYLPILIVMKLWGTAGLANLFFFNLGSNIAYWTIGIGLLGESNIRSTAKNLLTPSLIALFLALVLSLTKLNLFIPNIALRICGSAGSASIPISLILIGASMYPFPSIRDKRDLMYLTFVRLVLLPALMIFLIWLLPVSADIKNIAFIVTLMPTAMSSMLLTRRFGGDSDFAARAAIITTTVSIVTIPLGLWLLEILGVWG